MLDTEARPTSHGSLATLEEVLPPTGSTKKPPLSPKPNSTSSVSKPPISPTSKPRVNTNEVPESSTTSFVMDWLQQLNVDHLDFARKSLWTPDRSSVNKKRVQFEVPVATTSSKEHLMLPDSQDLASTASTASLSTQSSTSSSSTSPRDQPPTSPASSSSLRQLNISPAVSFRKRSILLGNGWNAKGLEKARQGNWEDALACWENALEIREQVLGEHHPDVANTWNNIGIALGKLEEFADALQTMQKALELRLHHYGNEKHAEIAATYHNIANIHQQAGSYEEALEALQKSLSISQGLFGRKDLQVARTRLAMGHTHYDAGEYDKALTAYREALDIMGLCHCAGDKNGLDCGVEIDQCRQDIEHTQELISTKTT